MIKRYLAISVALVLALSLLAGCSQASAETPGTQSKPSQQQETLQEANPLTGLQKEADYPPNTRPVAIMINNIKEALPQTGLQSADLIYEMVTEGGITRLMAVYSDYTKLGLVGPVRSARDQHLQLAFPLQALYVHIGSSTYARDMLDAYKYEEKDLDGNLGSVREVAFYLDEERHKTKNIEHCYYTSGEMIEAAVEKYNMETALTETLNPIFDFVSYKETPRKLKTGEATTVDWKFSLSNTTGFTYNTKNNCYEKSAFGEPQIDTATGEALYFDNVLLLFTEITPRADNVLMNVNYNYGGIGYYFNGGRYELVRWLKGVPEQPLRIVDAGGNEVNVKINPGKTYVAVVGDTMIGTLTIDDEVVYPEAKVSEPTAEVKG
ncbi:MAG: DUF3048 domain-containing protein [Oscillospiraceae bacterium]|nr:DUF3048 domain-containing protein [Oscillospiraceae bacterium]